MTRNKHVYRPIDEINKALEKQEENWQRLRKKFLTWLIILMSREIVLAIGNPLT
jgi:hypothetical protein